MIDENKLIEDLQKKFPEWKSSSVGGIVKIIIDKVIRIIKEQPTVEAVPVVHGEWIHDINNLYGCSVCMNRETMSPNKKKNFCPNCGADMRKKVE